ncbi:cks-1, partial [Pristionchus pacificus]
MGPICYIQEQKKLSRNHTNYVDCVRFFDISLLTKLAHLHMPDEDTRLFKFDADPMKEVFQITFKPLGRLMADGGRVAIFVFTAEKPKVDVPTEESTKYDIMAAATDFYYSNKYEDDEYEYRHVHAPKEVTKLIPKNRLMSESEWRSLGIQQSPGWVHYMIHPPERHVLLFRRPLPKQPATATGGATATNGKV